MLNQDKSETFANSLIVYWGNFGGGVRLANSLFQFALENQVKIYFSFSKNNESFSVDQQQAMLTKEFLVSTPKRKFKNLNLASAFKQSNQVKKQILKSNIEQVVMLMPHPWDFILQLMLRPHKIRILRCMHDAKAHPGDKKIPNWYIKILFRTSSENIFFSRFVANQFKLSNKKSQILSLIDYPSVNRIARDENLILFIGRIKHYKGLELLADAWELIDKTKMSLKICGAGNGIPQYLLEHAQIINQWIPESEINDLIGSAKVIVLPYLEASQSGVIPIARNLGTNIVVTPHAGLIEQLENRPNCVVAKNFTPLALARAIEKAHQLPNMRTRENNASAVEILVKLGGKF